MSIFKSRIIARNIIFVFLCVFCCASLSAKQSIDIEKFEEDWDELCNRVNCVYIDGYCKTLKGKSDIKSYKDKINPALSEGNYRLKYSDLSQLLDTNNFKNTKRDVLDPLNKRSEDYTIDNLLSIDALKGQKVKYILTPVRDSLKQVLISEYSISDKLSTANLGNTAEQYRERSYAANAFNKAMIVMIILLYVIFIVSLFVLFKYLKPKRDLMPDKKDHQNGNMNINFDDLNKRVMNLEKQIQIQTSLEDRLKSLEQKVDNQEQQAKAKLNTDNSKMQDSSAEIKTSNAGYATNESEIYLRRADRSGRLVEVDSHKAFFVAQIKGDKGSFSFQGNPANALSSVNAVFDTVCTTKGSINGPSTGIYTKQKGIIVKEGDLWRVENKATIEFK